MLANPSVIWSYLRPYGYSYFLFLFPMSPVFALLSKSVENLTLPMASLDPRLNPGAQWGITVVPGLLFDFLVKLPLIVSDIAVAMIVYKLTYRLSHVREMATSAAALWFLNPFVIWVSAAWGMFDTLPALFTILAAYLAMTRRLTYSAVALAVAIALKYYAVVLVFPLLVMAWRIGGRRELAKAATVFFVSTAILFAPSLTKSGAAVVELSSSPALSSTSYSGLSILTAVTLFATTNVALFSTSMVTGSLLLVYYGIVHRSKVMKASDIIAYFGISLLPLLLFYSYVGENFLIWVLPFGAILASDDSITRRLYWALSLVGLTSSVTDSLLPYYLLPVSPWIGGLLVLILQLAGPYRVAHSGTMARGISTGKLALVSFSLSSFLILFALLLRWFRSLGEGRPVRD